MLYTPIDGEQHGVVLLREEYVAVKGDETTSAMFQQ